LSALASYCFEEVEVAAQGVEAVQVAAVAGAVMRLGK
jgi:hypothetical protein